jgi:hypothetical protein
MSPLERLLQEAIPLRPAPAQPGGLWSRQEQDRHWADLCDTVGTPGAPRPQHSAPEPVIDEPAAEQPAAA